MAVLAIDLVVPEHVVEPWTAAQRWETMIIERLAGFGGSLVARSPSRLIAVFGVPRALEQLPQRAVLAALSVRRLAVADGPELRMAVHAGAARVDLAARDVSAGLLPVGDTLALPDRLLGHAGPGEILVSPAVSRRIEAWCELRGRELRLGESDTLLAHAVVGRRAATATEEPRAGQQTTFVGRQRELELLRETFASAAAGHGQVVFVVGEAGLGKSRLLAELRARVAGETHCWVEGRCASYGATTAFLPVIDALRRAWGLDDQDDESGARAKVERAIAQLGDEVAWTLPFVRHVLGLAADDATLAALDSATRRSEIFRALKALVLRVARETPLVLVVEDLHWIDSASEECLVFLADVVPTTRAVLICSYRPGHAHRFGDRSFHVRVTLQPLTAGEMGDISGALLGTRDIPSEVSALIAAKAEGNPFFVEEVTRSLLEDGTLRRDNGRVVLAHEAGAIAVPDSIQDVLAARLDRLADDARQAIQVASVIGREFALRLLERITEAGEHVRTHVEELRTLELIYEKAAHPELAYMFKHALTHDVAYESVLHDRRRALHRTIGLAIEELYADRIAEFYETLAHHFGRAEEWGQALDYHERAAAKAAESFANRAVVVHCRQALAIADRLGADVPQERRRALEEQLALACFYVNDFELSGEAYARAAACSSDPGTRALDLGWSGLSFFWGNAYARADAAVEQALEVAQRHGQIAAEAVAVSNAGFFRGVCEGDVDGELFAMERALALATRAGNEMVVAFICFYMAQVAEWRGDYRRSIALSERAIAGGRRFRLAHLVIWPGWFLGKALCCLGEYGAAIVRLTEAAEVCDRIGDRVWKSRLLNTLGWCFGEIGSIERARAHNARAAVIAHEVGDAEIVGNSEINLAANHLALGDLERDPGLPRPHRAAAGAPGGPLDAVALRAAREASRGTPGAPGGRPERSAGARARRDRRRAAPSCAEDRGTGAHPRRRRTARHGRAARRARGARRRDRDRRHDRLSACDAGGPRAARRAGAPGGACGGGGAARRQASRAAGVCAAHPVRGRAATGPGRRGGALKSCGAIVGHCRCSVSSSRACCWRAGRDTPRPTVRRRMQRCAARLRAATSPGSSGGMAARSGSAFHTRRRPSARSAGGRRRRHSAGTASVTRSPPHLRACSTRVPSAAWKTCPGARRPAPRTAST